VKVIRNRAAARRMLQEQLGTMRHRGTKLQDRFITCTTGHRGAINPTAAER